MEEYFHESELFFEPDRRGKIVLKSANAAVWHDVSE